jgi:CheY-like chemotaxis protein
MGDESGSNPSPEQGRPSFSTSPTETGTTKRRSFVLVVEDNPADVFLLREAMVVHQLAIELHVVQDGEKAFDYIDRADADENAECPNLVLLDLNIPRRSGQEVLLHLRRSKKCAHTPVLVVTSSGSDTDRAETERLGANGYFRKPSTYDAFLEIGEIIRTMLRE